MNTGDTPFMSDSGLLTTLAWGIDGRVEYALEGSVFSAGATVQWLRDGLGLIESAAESEGLARSVPDAGGVYLVPAFAGLGAPYWDERARGTLVGLTRGTTRAHLVRAGLESIAFGSRDVVDCMAQDSGLAMDQLRVDGGACRNDFLMQFQADLLGAVVERPSMLEVTALGAALLAGLGVGFWSDREALSQTRGEVQYFEPRLDETDRDILYRDWQRAVDRSRDWAV
jgi:glycerol kinase